MSNIVYIATSLDGYIAGPEGELDWLDMVPNPAGDDLGFAEFMARVDAVVMEPDNVRGSGWLRSRLAVFGARPHSEFDL